jgi:hypothetical protein
MVDHPQAPKLSLVWMLWCYGLCLVPCFGSALLLVFPFGRMQRIWRNRGYPVAKREALWAQLRFHRWLAFGISLAVWAMTFILPFVLGLALRLVEAVR